MGVNPDRPEPRVTAVINLQASQGHYPIPTGAAPLSAASSDHSLRRSCIVSPPFAPCILPSEKPDSQARPAPAVDRSHLPLGANYGIAESAAAGHERRSLNR